MNSRGKFITLEGVDGSGKTTQAALLASYLRKEGIEVVDTREPGGTNLGEEIRRVLLSPGNSDLTDIAELLLFSAARAQLVAEVIKPSLAEGKWVISDRFSDSTIAYQGYGRGIEIDVIRKLNEVAAAGLEPDMTIILDLDVETGIRRAFSSQMEFTGNEAGDRMEMEQEEFHESIREGYLQLAKREPDRIKTIQVKGSIEEVHKSIVSLIEPFLTKSI